MNLLLPRNTVVLLTVLVIVVSTFGAGATIGAHEAAAGNPTPMANDSMPPLEQTLVSDIRSDMDGLAIVEAVAVDAARSAASIAAVGIAVGYTSVGVLGEHITDAWIKAIPVLLMVLTAVTVIQFVEKLREVRQ